MKRWLMPLVLSMVLIAPQAMAQDDGDLSERLDRLERDLSFVQKQVYRGGSAADGTGAPAPSGQVQMRVAQLEEEMRKLRGQLEQVQFQNKQTADSIKKLSDDVDYRLRALEQKAAAAPAAEAVVVVPEAKTVDTSKPANYQPEKEKPAKKDEEKGALTGKDFPNSNAHYSYAYKLISEKKYSEAAASFDTFVKKYPEDPLTSNAYYWLGESQYARKDYTRSAESFRKGFEVNPEGQKAPDNLYKLALSLTEIKRVSEACVVLQQVVSKYGESASRTAAKATEARMNLQCK